MNIKLSVIVPVYNVDKYLERCLNSLVNQTLKEIEIIIVNDGSTDNSQKICEEYARKYSQVKLINKNNEGVSKARNIALKEVKGEYLTFIDSDDWIEKDAYEIMYNEAKKKNADIVQCTFREVMEDGTIYVLNKFNQNKEYIGEDILREFLLGNINAVVWDKIYKTSIWIDNNIVFPEDLKLVEDQLPTCQVLYNSEKYIVLKDVLYNYYRRLDSCTISNFSAKNMDMITSMQSIKEFLKEKRMSHYIENEYIVRYVNTVTTFTINKYISNKNHKSKKLKQAFITDFRLNTRYYYKKNFISFKKKIQIFLIKNFFSIYSILLRTRNFVKDLKTK